MSLFEGDAKCNRLRETGASLAMVSSKKMQNDDEHLREAKEMLAMARDLGPRSHGEGSEFLKSVNERMNNCWRREFLIVELIRL